MSRVLLCGRAGALELPAIAEALRERNVEPIVVDSSVFPTGVPLTLGYERDEFLASWAGEAHGLGLGDASDGRRDPPGGISAGISAVWQSLVVGVELPAMAPGMYETCIAGSERAMIGWLDSLPVFQLDPYWNKARADNKPYQLRLAQQVGLEIPRTIVSNDPDAVRRFARRVGPVITKMLVQPAGAAADGEVSVVFTTAMTEADLAQLDGLDLCPMIFQEQIENRRDVRVVVAGRRVFGAALDTATRGGDDLDWRRQSYAVDHAPAWTTYALPREVADRLVRLLDLLGLNYGAADFVVTPEGRHVFLELNASGSFGFLRDGSLHPIAAAIADVLVDPDARRGGQPGT